MGERRKVSLSQDKINELYSVFEWLTKSPELMNLELYKTDSRFAYAVAYNQDAIEGHVRRFYKYVSSDKNYESSDAARMKLIEETHGLRNEKGELIIINGSYVMKNQTAFERAWEELMPQYPAYQIRQDKLEEIFMVELHTVLFDYVPKWLPPQAMRAMLPFIIYEPELAVVK